eukprot:gene2049-2327_t
MTTLTELGAGAGIAFDFSTEFRWHPVARMWKRRT